MAGRKPGFRHNEETRAKIRTSQLINRLEDHVFAEKPILDSSQVNAAKALLAKVLPDLSATDASVELSGEIGVRATKEQRDAAVSAALRADTDG